MSPSTKRIWNPDSGQSLVRTPLFFTYDTLSCHVMLFVCLKCLRPCLSHKCSLRDIRFYVHGGFMFQLNPSFSTHINTGKVFYFVSVAPKEQNFFVFFFGWGWGQKEFFFCFMRHPIFATTIIQISVKRWQPTCWILLHLLHLKGIRGVLLLIKFALF